MELVFQILGGLNKLGPKNPHEGPQNPQKAA